MIRNEFRIFFSLYHISLCLAIGNRARRFNRDHGYGRYIVEIRELLDLDAVVRERRRNGYDAARIQIHQTLKQVWDNGGNLDRDTAMKLGAMTERMVQALEPYYRHAEKLDTVLYELQAKYASYVRGER